MTTDTVEVIKDGRLVSNHLRISFILREIRVYGSVSEAAKRCHCTNDEVAAVLDKAAATCESWLE